VQGKEVNKEVSWNMVYDKVRSVWKVYHAIEDKQAKADFQKAMGQFMETVTRIHGFVPEDVSTNK
jgi:hypothetical protein